MNHSPEYDSLERRLNQLGADEQSNLNAALEYRVMLATQRVRQERPPVVVASPWRRRLAMAAAVTVATGAALTVWLMGSRVTAPTPTAEMSIEAEFDAWLESDFLQAGLVEHASLRHELDTLENNLGDLWPEHDVLLDEEMM
jgi:uncharacterized phage protein gp47/JayE